MHSGLLLWVAVVPLHHRLSKLQTFREVCSVNCI